jgi:hypothetical protein
MPIGKKGTKKLVAKKKIAKKKVVIKKAIATKAAEKATPRVAGQRSKKNTLYMESAAFMPLNSTDGYIDNFHDGRHTATPNRSLVVPIMLPVGGVIQSLSIHYVNTTSANVIAMFLRKHADRVSPSGEIEMAFITLPSGFLLPDNYLTATHTNFSAGGIIEDRFLHYLEIPGTGDFGTDGKITIRGISINYQY